MPLPRTPVILDYLKALGAPVTFFVVGVMASYHPSVIVREFAEGHTIASHSYSHPDMTPFTPTGVMAEVLQNEELLASITCYRPKIFRPPFGALTNAQIALIHVRGCVCRFGISNGA